MELKVGDRVRQTEESLKRFDALAGLISERVGRPGKSLSDPNNVRHACRAGRLGSISEVEIRLPGHKKQFTMYRVVWDDGGDENWTCPPLIEKI